MLGNALIGTGVMLLPGMLTVLANDLGVSIPAAGALIGVAAVVMCIGSPVLATWTSRWDRRLLLGGSIAFYGAAHVACALAPDYTWLLVVRSLTMVSAAIFTPQAGALLSQVLPPHRRSAGITFVFLGWSIASVGAMPLAAWLGAHVGWRVTFAGFGLLCIAGSVLVWRAVPANTQGIAISKAAWLRVARHPALIAILLVTAASGTGQFTTWAYIAPFTQAMLAPSPTLFAGLLMLFGAAGLMGNLAASRNAASSWRFNGPHWNVHVACTSMAIGMLIMSVAAQHLGAYVVAVLLWGVGVFAANSSQQARLSVASPELAGASIALNTTMIYVGQAAGTLIGGTVISHWGYAPLPIVGAVLLSVSVVLSLRASAKMRAARAALSVAPGQ